MVISFDNKNKENKIRNINVLLNLLKDSTIIFHNGSLNKLESKKEIEIACNKYNPFLLSGNIFYLAHYRKEYIDYSLENNSIKEIREKIKELLL